MRVVFYPRKPTSKERKKERKKDFCLFQVIYSLYTEKLHLLLYCFLFFFFFFFFECDIVAVIHFYGFKKPFGYV